MRELRTIGVFGHYGNKNLGDEAIILAVIQNIKKRLPGKNIYCFSVNPDDSRERYGVPAFPLRRSFYGKERINVATSEQLFNFNDDEKKSSLAFKLKDFTKKIPIVFESLRIVKKIIELPSICLAEFSFIHESRKVLKQVDLLIIAGSNQFLDNFGGAWGFPYTLFKWSLLAKITKTKVVHVSIGAGPLDLLLSKLFLKGSVALSSYLSYRDLGSKILTSSFLAFKDSKVYPDLAFSLSFADKNNERKASNNNSRLIVGVNPMPVYDERYWHVAENFKYHEYVINLTKFVVDIIKKGHRVQLFSTHPKDELVGLDIMKYVAETIDTEEDDISLVEHANSVDSLMQLINSFDVVVATRFHGVLLSLLSNKNVIAICYGMKTKEIMIEMELQKYAFDLDLLNYKELIESFSELITNKEIQRDRIRLKCLQYEKLLDQQYNSILVSNQ